jgi:hypothetical protein
MGASPEKARKNNKIQRNRKEQTGGDPALLFFTLLDQPGLHSLAFPPELAP